MDLKNYNFIQLPDSGQIEGNVNARYSPHIFYNNDVDKFFENAKKLGIEEIYLWMNHTTNQPQNSVTFYCFIDKNSVIHKAQLNGGWETPNEAIEAEKLGFSNPLQYREAIKLGFQNFDEFEDYRNSGFNDKEEFESMIRLGFRNHVELDNAVKIGCSNSKEVELLEKSDFPHMDLKKEADKEKTESLEIYILIKTIRSLPKGLPTPFVTISQEFDKMVDYTLSKYRGVSNTHLNQSYNLPSINLSEEMFKENIIKKLGMYNSKLNLFYKGIKPDFREKYEINQDVIVVDGNNVCFDDSKNCPSTERLMAVKNKFRGKDVRIFVSGYMKDGGHGEWDDKKTLEKMISAGDIEVTPPQYEDDYWWLELVFEKKGLAITNDKLTDWIVKNPEKTGELYARKVPFMISKSDVMLGEPLGNLKR